MVGSKSMTEQRVILGNALDRLNDFSDESFDLIIVDPPYNLGKNYGNNHDVKASTTIFRSLMIGLAIVYVCSNRMELCMFLWGFDLYRTFTVFWSKSWRCFSTVGSYGITLKA